MTCIQPDVTETVKTVTVRLEFTLPASGIQPVVYTQTFQGTKETAMAVACYRAGQLFGSNWCIAGVQVL